MTGAAANDVRRTVQTRSRQKNGSLKQLTASLPTLTPLSYELALRASALHLQGRDEEIDISRLCEALAGVTDMEQLLDSCCHLLRQVGRKGGMTEEKLKSSLVPLGFEECHVKRLAEVLDWVRNGSPAGAPTKGKSSPPASPPPTDPPAIEEEKAPKEIAGTWCEGEPPFVAPTAVQPTTDETTVVDQCLDVQQAKEERYAVAALQPVSKQAEEGADKRCPPTMEDKELGDVPTPQTEAELAAKYLGRLSGVAEDAARVQVEAMDYDAKTAKVSSLPSGKWGIMTWEERLEFLHSCPKVGQATVEAQRRSKLCAIIRAEPTLNIYVAVAAFNGTVLQSPAWREDEDLSVDIGDIVISVGPAPYGKKGWSVGFKVDDWPTGCNVASLGADQVKVFPSCKNFVRRLCVDDVAQLSSHALDVITQFNEKARDLDPTLGYTAVPRVSVEAVEVTGAVSRRSTSVDALGRQVEKNIVYYSVHCAGPARESWTVQRRYSEFERLRDELIHAATIDSPNEVQLSREDLVGLSFPTKHSAHTGKKLRASRINGFHEWLQIVHARAAKAGRTSFAYILVRRFLRPDSPLKQRFTGFEHSGQRFPQLDLRVYPDTDAKATADFVAMKLGIQAVSTFTAQLSKFITANGRLRLEVDHLVPAGLGVQYVMVLPSDKTAETAVNRFAIRVNEEFEFEISDSCKREIIDEIKQRMRRI